jgi:hypothetical protein
MMEDSRVAEMFLSAIIQEKITELDFSAQEQTVRVPPQEATGQKKKPEGPGLNLPVCRFDFSARIATPEGGFKKVLIELQKARQASDITRFSRYPLHPLYCICVLGGGIGFPGSPVIRVNSTVKDVMTGKLLSPGPNEFLDSLCRRSWIVQTDQLKSRRRTDLEKLLSIFDQDNRTEDHHILNMDEDVFPEEYHPIIHRLRMAIENEDLQIEMKMEDDYLKELQDR